MNKTVIVQAMVLCLISCAIAAEADSAAQEKRARRKARIEAKIAADGGMVTKANSGNYARIVNCQKTISTDFIRGIADQFNTGLNIYIDFSDLEPNDNPFKLAENALAIPHTGIATIIVDDPNLPPLLSAMENGWAILNIRHLRDDLPPKAVYELRLRKEINRAFALAAGAGLSFNKPCVMEPVYKMSDLDAISFPVMSPEAMSKVSQACAKRGIAPVRIETYRTACKEGWAPAPTNDVQKAIWKETHTIPDKPLTIQYDPKKDK